jgi:hypothetical protein
MIVALVLVAVYGVVRVASGHESHKSVERAAAPATSKPTASHPAAVAQAPRKDVTVRVRAKRASWLNVHDAKGKELYSGIIRAGQSQEWTSKKRIRLLIGNGGGLKLTVNGKEIGSPGEAGQVVRLSYGPRDPIKG